MKGWLTSSQSPDQVSNTVKGVVLALSGVGLWALAQLGVPYTDADWATLASEVGTALGSIWAVWGLVMKVVMAVGKA